MQKSLEESEQNDQFESFDETSVLQQQEGTNCDGEIKNDESSILQSKIDFATSGRPSAKPKCKASGSRKNMKKSYAGNAEIFRKVALLLIYADQEIEQKGKPSPTPSQTNPTKPHQPKSTQKLPKNAQDKQQTKSQPKGPSSDPNTQSKWLSESP